MCIFHVSSLLDTLQFNTNEYIVSLEMFFEFNVMVFIVQADLKKRGYDAIWSSCPENQEHTVLIEHKTFRNIVTLIFG